MTAVATIVSAPGQANSAPPAGAGRWVNLGSEELADSPTEQASAFGRVPTALQSPTSSATEPQSQARSQWSQTLREQMQQDDRSAEFAQTEKLEAMAEGVRSVASPPNKSAAEGVMQAEGSGSAGILPFVHAANEKSSRQVLAKSIPLEPVQGKATANGAQVSPETSPGLSAHRSDRLTQMPENSVRTAKSFVLRREQSSDLPTTASSHSLSQADLSRADVSHANSLTASPEEVVTASSPLSGSVLSNALAPDRQAVEGNSSGAFTSQGFSLRGKASESSAYGIEVASRAVPTGIPESELSAADRDSTTQPVAVKPVEPQSSLLSSTYLAHPFAQADLEEKGSGVTAAPVLPVRFAAAAVREFTLKTGNTQASKSLNSSISTDFRSADSLPSASLPAAQNSGLDNSGLDKTDAAPAEATTSRANVAEKEASRASTDPRTVAAVLRVGSIGEADSVRPALPLAVVGAIENTVTPAVPQSTDQASPGKTLVALADPTGSVSNGTAPTVFAPGATASAETTSALRYQGLAAHAIKEVASVGGTIRRATTDSSTLTQDSTGDRLQVQGGVTLASPAGSLQARSGSHLEAKVSSESSSAPVPGPVSAPAGAAIENRHLPATMAPAAKADSAHASSSLAGDTSEHVFPRLAPSDISDGRIAAASTATLHATEATHAVIPSLSLLPTAAAEPASPVGSTETETHTARDTNPFEAMDLTSARQSTSVSSGGSAASSQTQAFLSTRGSSQLEVGYHDPALGYVELRAHAGPDGVHASLLPESAYSQQTLSQQLGPLTGWMADRRTPLESLSVLEFSSGSGASGQGHAQTAAGAEGDRHHAQDRTGAAEAFDSTAPGDASGSLQRIPPAGSTGSRPSVWSEGAASSSRSQALIAPGSSFSALA